MSLIPGRPFLDANQVVQIKTITTTLAELNAGKVLLPAVAGQQYELVSIHWLTTGAFITLTAAIIATTEDTPTALFTVVQAQLGDAVVHSHLTGTNTLAAAFWAALVIGYGVKIYQSGTAAAGGTSITVKLGYKVVKPSA